MKHKNVFKNQLKSTKNQERWNLPDMCERCSLTCELRVPKGGDLIHCQQYKSKTHSTSILYVKQRDE